MKRTFLNKYVIIVLLLILLSGLFYYIFCRSVEGLENDNQDDFAVALNVVLNNKNGILVPKPNGSFNVSSSSSTFKNEMDFSMNNVALISAFAYRDMSGNFANRTITIKPISTNNEDKTGNTGDVIPNHFKLDISFNKIVYKLDTVSDIKSINQSEKDKKKHLPIDFLNKISNDGILNITSIGPIYDSNNVKIGKVNLDSNDSNNEKSFEIKVDIPTDPKNLTKDYIKQILITFKSPIDMKDKLNLPTPPKPIDQSTIDNMKRPS